MFKSKLNIFNNCYYICSVFYEYILIFFNRFIICCFRTFNNGTPNHSMMWNINTMQISATASAAYWRRMEAKISLRNGVLMKIMARITVLLMRAMAQRIGIRIKRSITESPLGAASIERIVELEPNSIETFGVAIVS